MLSTRTSCKTKKKAISRISRTWNHKVRSFNVLKEMMVLLMLL